ncbi:MAG: zf-HC2 domain-containing protein [Bacilli bacterium]|nr:zf-HC2 domain-containing protein [Bacilli bacterium]
MKKNCNIIKDLLPLYIDDVCTNDSRNLVDEHLKECHNCQKELKNLQHTINISKKNDINAFKKIIKKINFKIIRNSIFITLLILVLLFPILYFIGSYEFTMKYDENIRIILHENGNRWNFQFDTPISGYTYAENKILTENGETINYIFVTRTYTIQEYLATKKNVYYGTAPNIDYSKINPKDNMKVYYTTEDMDIIKNASLEELKAIIDKSVLIFDKQIKTSEINCTLNNKEYNYTLTYYKVSEQIIESTGDENMPDDLLTYVYSIKGDHNTVWLTGDKASDIIEKIDNYITSNYGTCTIDYK